MAENERRWLREGEKDGEHIAIVSYPRSGNSLMRGLLESITGIYTGCDTQPDRTLSVELQKYGLKGEGVVDETVWFVKSHYPERSGYKPVAIQKAILVVRNPWDAINSYFNMTLTNSHNKSVHDSQYERFAARWDGMIRNEILVWLRFHLYWSRADIPVMFVRYEDLMVNRKEMLHRVFKFILDKDPREQLWGTEWGDRIEAVLNSDDAGPYKPRSGKIGASFRHYSPEQHQHVLNKARPLLRQFGYDTETQDFPNSIPLPNRQVKYGKQDAALLVLSVDGLELRARNDMFGRLSTYYRKMLLDPVIAADGSELNMEEMLCVEDRPLLNSDDLKPGEVAGYTPFMSLDKGKERTTSNQLGTFNGVYVPCLLNIIGVILFLRLGWAIGQAGVLGMLVIFFIAESQAILTVLSASAIASNGNMRGGGSYYLISRSLGPEFGGAIGLQFYLLYASGVAMYLVGLAEEIQQTWFEHSTWEKKHVVVLVASLALVSITMIALIGANAFSKVNQYLFVVQFACIAFGAIAICTTTPHNLLNGGRVTGPSSKTLHDNFYANYTSERNACGPNTVCSFSRVYAIVFPLATGFMEGLNLSGDLKHPGKSIPIGSLAAICTACAIYISLILLFGSSFTGVTLRTNYTFFQEVGATPYIVIAGILVSCYTSGLGSLFGASRILQAISRDHLFPGLSVLGQGTVHGDEPQFAVVFTAFLSFGFILIGDLDVLAPICTSFFCLAYAAVNFTAFTLQVTGVPNFRPTFRYSCWPLALLGVVVNLGVMVYLNALYAALTLLVLSGLFFYLYIAGPTTSWGSVSQALIYHQVRKYLLRLDTRKVHLKYWRPAILLVAKSKQDVSVVLCNQLKKGGLFIIGDLVFGELNTATAQRRHYLYHEWLDYIQAHKLKAIPQVIVTKSLREGYNSLLQLSGLGGMDINTLAIDWVEDDILGVIEDALLLQKNIVVLRHCDNIDPRFLLETKATPESSTLDVWLTSEDATAMLMLQLTHVLHSNSSWSCLPIRLLRVCELIESEDGNSMEIDRNRLMTLAQDLRIQLHPSNAIVLPIPRHFTLSDFYHLVHEHSAQAQMIVLPMPPFTPDTTYAQTLSSFTSGLPPTMLVHSAQDVSVITTCI
ncbi:basolateral NaK(2Cl) cotransporter [Thraustotheca clavata]|uniref:Basolateral NaK(2Cl) cotransporter n=1 Tax=Thraustotheca clavata TaxID=74557 RepID=A0A1W0A7W3_9STRA|nr:basolateral NaK(2Cl) cotransporter [Thraustotheca clavata]